LLPSLSRHADANGFPSGHMIRATFLYGLCLYLAERWQLFGRDSSRLSPILVVVVILLGYALCYLGAHWFSDVLGGTLLGLSILVATIAYLERKRQVTIEEALDY
jgi:membrane-associated phospholipid phosphatase